MLNFTYKEDIKIKNKHVAGISRTFYLSTETIGRPPQSREIIPLKWLLKCIIQKGMVLMVWVVCIGASPLPHLLPAHHLEQGGGSANFRQDILTKI
jgi:hypothetical protein